MKRVDKEAWIKALRSGKYVQGTDFLTRFSKDIERDCCLGVICKILDVPRTPYMNVFYYGYKKQNANALPDEIANRLEISTVGHLSFKDREHMSIALSYLNDHYFTFDQIADIIEYDFEVTD